MPRKLGAAFVAGGDSPSERSISAALYHLVGFALRWVQTNGTGTDRAPNTVYHCPFM